MKKVSVIIRTKNEERWIGSCLKAVYAQNYKNLEVILVDNMSTDQTVEKAQQWPIKLVTIKEFKPGHAINEGIRASTGEILICLSGHCIPTDEYWLENLIAPLEEKDVAGVYGRQQPLSFSTALDKRDLYLTFGLDRITQTKDSFFHNANSAFTRKVWEKFPFDELVTNVEDRVWGRQVINAKYKIIYEPSASVYHYHGIHHGMDGDRANKVVRILEEVEGLSRSTIKLQDKPSVIAIIPSKGALKKVHGEPLLAYPIKACQESEYISDIVVTTDNDETINYAKSCGIKTIKRPTELSEDYIGIGEVFSYSLKEYEKEYNIPDLVVLLEETHIFRETGLLDKLVCELINQGFDSTIVAKKEKRFAWLENTKKVKKFINESFVPRLMQDEFLSIGLLGAGCVTHPEFIRNCSIIGPRLGIIESKHPLISTEIRDHEDTVFVEKLLKNQHE